MAAATLTTSAEFLARPDEFDQSGNQIKEELIGGEIVQMPHTSKRHDLTKSDIAKALILHLHAHPESNRKILIEAGFVVSEQDTFAPDVAVVRKERLAEEGRLINGAPDIAIEVISPTDTTRGIRRKIKAYLEDGALSVWIFYDDSTVAVHTATGVRELSGEQQLEDPLLPGFSVPISTFYLLP
jgi:Uma2 family endonuclease